MYKLPMKAVGLAAQNAKNLRIHFKCTLPDLPYDYNALEPYISAEIMQLHHLKHHATYVNNFNIAEEKISEAIARQDVKSLIALGPALKFNGGGHLNHSIFWHNLSPNGGGEPTGNLLKQIQTDFGSFNALKERLSAISSGVQGSGWGWLGWNKTLKKLEITSLPNQDPLEPSTGLVPLFGIDVWEHAYYLQYKNVRADYVKQIFNVANWSDVSRRFEEAQKV